MQGNSEIFVPLFQPRFGRLGSQKGLGTGHTTQNRTANEAKQKKSPFCHQKPALPPNTRNEGIG